MRMCRESSDHMMGCVTDNNIVLQFGRRSKNQFALDFTYPFNTKQAFGFALSVLWSEAIWDSIDATTIAYVAWWHDLSNLIARPVYRKMSAANLNMH